MVKRGEETNGFLGMSHVLLLMVACTTISSDSASAFSAVVLHQNSISPMSLVRTRTTRNSFRTTKLTSAVTAAVAGSGSALYSYESGSLDERGTWTLSNDFRLLLTQCTIQSFMFLVSSMKDPETTLWMERFTRPVIDKNQFEKADESNWQSGKFEAVDNEEGLEKQDQTVTLLRYHGLAALNTTIFPTWDSYFFEMLKEQTVVYDVVSEKAYIRDYEIEVNPASLCSRILSVRTQIANEWTHDLSVIASMGGSTLESYWENLRNKSGVNNDSGTDTPASAGIDRQNLLFLEWTPDRNSDLLPSPLRKGNFDLLTLCTTQEAIHRVLNDKSRQSGPEGLSNRFLENFYNERILSHFSGFQRFGRADDFLEELLMSSPTMIQVEEGVTRLIDPIHIATIILDQRATVAFEWQEIAEESPNAKEKTEIQRAMLNRMMGI